MNNKLFDELQLGNTKLKNRIVRAATYEGYGDVSGIPDEKLANLYEDLAKNNVGLIITGFNFTSTEGRAMQPRQCGIDHEDKIAPWKKITDRIKKYDTKICMQISHAGRQTISNITHSPVLAPSNVKCTYFKSKITVLTENKILDIIEEYAQASLRAQKAGFDGVQIHCAHGYLIHQFFSAYTNRRKDKWGGNHKNRFEFAKLILSRIRELCGKDFLVLVKISSSDDRQFSSTDCISFSKLIEETGNVDAIEISYGTMEYAINIFRGDVPIKIAMKHNPLFNKHSPFIQKLWMIFFYPSYMKKIKPFTENYNLEIALKVADNVNLPIIVTGGIRKKSSINKILSKKISAISLSRPLICEPDLITTLTNQDEYEFKCINCNICTMMCDSNKPLRCYKN